MAKDKKNKSNGAAVAVAAPVAEVSTPVAAAPVAPTTAAPVAEVTTGSPPAAAPSPVSTTEKIMVDSQALTTAGKPGFFTFALLYLANNVRTEATYQIPAMVASILRHGFKPNHGLVISRKSDGRGLVLCGNRRTKALQHIAETLPAEFARILPAGEIPAVIYDNLTESQEALLRIDHGSDEDRVGLDDWGYFLAVKQLVSAEFLSESGIAEKLGKFTEDKQTGELKPARSWVQPRVMLAQLPAMVQEQFRLLWTDGKTATPVRLAMIPKLYAVFNEEYRNFPQGQGPQFTALWNECLGKVETVKAKPVVILPAAALEKSRHVGSRLLQECLKIIGGKPADNPASGQPFNIADIDAGIIVAEAAQVTLGEIAAYLGETEFRQLVSNARQSAADKAAATAAAIAAAQPATGSPVAVAVPSQVADMGNGTEGNLTAGEIAAVETAAV